MIPVILQEVDIVGLNRLINQDIKKFLFSLLIKNSEYDEVPFEEIHRPRYSWINTQLEEAYEAYLKTITVSII